MADKLPGARAALVDNAGVTTPQFYRYFQALERSQAGTASAADVAAINAQIAAINAEIAALPKSSYPTLQVSAPLTSAGLLQNGFAKLGLTIANSITVNGVALQLSGDALAPGNTYLYSTSPTGVKGWNALGGMLAGTTNNIAKTVNADGTVTFDLAPVTDSGAGSFKLITHDSFGRVTGTKAGTTSDVPEGTNLYHTAPRTLATVLAGLSTATNAAITAADTVLSAPGKLQAQISANVTAIAQKGPDTSSRTNIEVTLSAAQTITVNAFNAIVFDTVARDALSEFNASTGAWTVANTGLYEVVFFGHFRGAADGAILATSIFVNGTETKRVGEQTASNPSLLPGGAGGSCGSACLLRLTTGDVVTARAYMSAAQSTTHQIDAIASMTYFQAFRLL